MPVLRNERAGLNERGLTVNEKPEKLCIFCAHLIWLQNRRMGSTWTGEYGSSGFDCSKDKFDAYGRGDDRSFRNISDVRELFLTAEKCPDYNPPVISGGEL